jgi:DNA phosphorothioation-dependent restriction protein DptH
MSDPVSEYVADAIIAHFRDQPPEPGRRFHLHLDDESAVAEIFQALKSRAEQVFEIDDYCTKAIHTDDVNLILASSAQGTTEGFLTRLRNGTSSQEDEFEQSALLIIHSTSLDSILGGAESLGRDGNPMHPDSLVARLNAGIDQLSINPKEKQVLATMLLETGEEIHGNGGSLAAFAPFMEVVQKRSFGPDDWNEIGLFPDLEVCGITSSRALSRRIKDNRRWFDHVQKKHEYGEPSSDLQCDFTRTGILKLSQEDWQQTSYAEVWKWHEQRTKSTPPEFLDAGYMTDDGLEFWERASGESTAERRKRHLLVLNPNSLGTVSVALNFDRMVSRSAVKIANAFPATFETKGKSVLVCVNGCEGDAVVVRVRYNDPEATGHYEFNIAVVPFGPALLHSCRATYEINGTTTGRRLRLPAEGLLVLNEGSDQEERLKLQRQMDVDVEDGCRTVLDIGDGADGDEVFVFSLRTAGKLTDCELRQETSKPVRVTGATIWKWKRERGRSFEFVDGQKLVFGNDEYYTDHEHTLQYLHAEEEIVAGNPHDCFWFQTKDGLIPRHMDIDGELRRRFADLVGFYRDRRLLPSLTSLSEAGLVDLMHSLVDRYAQLVGEIQEGVPLRPSERDLLRVGAIEKPGADTQFCMTPLHPLNVAYQLAIHQELGKEDLPQEILACLSPRDLVPYVRSPDGGSGRVLSPVMATQLPEWTIYRPYDTNQRGWQNDFIHKLVADKIREYTRHFPQLWTPDHRGPLRINLVNLGDCVDALKGIVSFFRSAMDDRDDAPASLPAMRVCAYGETNGANSFVDFGLFPDPESIKQHFEIELGSRKHDDMAVLQALRQKLRFYAKDKGTPYEYAHLTFFRFPGESIEWSFQSMASAPSGCAMEGLLNSVPALYSRGHYASGFGTAHSPDPLPPVVTLARSLNALAKAAHTTDPYSDSDAIFAVLPADIRSELDALYSTSNWVTFVEPRVDLNFFKNTDDTGELVIIHYTDQYTSTNSLDAITVTRKSEQYRAILAEFTEAHEMPVERLRDEALLAMFNAVNGNWLLRLLSGRGHFGREKISILSAVKAMLAVLQHPDFVWVPLSLEEVLRVSGNVGLKQSEGLFSKKNLGLAGPYCDDLLMVGVEKREGAVKLHLLPVEVKIGQTGAGVVAKAQEQGKHTADALRTFLTPKVESFRTRFYRTFFAKLAIAAAQRFALYGLVPEQDWSVLTADLRCELLNDDYEICWDLAQPVGEFAVLCFSSGAIARSLSRSENCLMVELLESDGASHLGMGVGELHNLYAGSDSTINESLLLCNAYRPDQAGGNGPGSGGDDGDDSGADDSGIDGSGKGGDGGEDDGGGASSRDHATTGMEILFGHDANNGVPIHWHPNDTDKVMHTNTGIIGTMGTGKTQFTKSLVTQLVQQSSNNVNGTKLGFLIFDYKGDYIKDDFIEATGAKKFDLFHLPYNPLALTVGESPLRKLPLHTANAIKESICKAYQAKGAKQKFRLRKVIMSAYERAGISADHPETWEKPAPTLQDVCEVFFDDDELVEDSLFAAMDSLMEFEIFQPDVAKTKSLWDLLGDVVIVNLSGYDQNIQDLVVAITLDQFYMQMQKAGHSSIQGNLREIRKMILVDEADNFLSQDFDSVKKILKEGREFGVGTILSTQFLSHFSTGDSDYANYILTWIVHQVTDLSLKTVPLVFGAHDKTTSANLVAGGTKLKKHFSLTNIGNGKPVLMRDMPFYELPGRASR